MHTICDTIYQSSRFDFLLYDLLLQSSRYKVVENGNPPNDLNDLGTPVNSTSSTQILIAEAEILVLLLLRSALLYQRQLSKIKKVANDLEHLTAKSSLYHQILTFEAQMFISFDLRQAVLIVENPTGLEHCQKCPIYN